MSIPEALRKNPPTPPSFGFQQGKEHFVELGTAVTAVADEVGPEPAAKAGQEGGRHFGGTLYSKGERQGVKERQVQALLAGGSWD